ncbi:MAG: UvrD-helicase domain-containing protein, partial [Lactobacillus sp.]|nr:UvrD-helicase domain-containing protein [Lactobacillus sp.]
MAKNTTEPPFTDIQRKAIADDNRDILVSASAGSGKTTVLVYRLLRAILNGTSIDQLLVVTFTKAAAAEMKKRIKDLLLVEYRNGNTKVNFRQQLNLIDSANISTVDAFCLDVIHRFYYVVGIDPSFSVLTDDTQAEL